MHEVTAVAFGDVEEAVEDTEATDAIITVVAVVHRVAIVKMTQAEPLTLLAVRNAMKNQVYTHL